MSGILCQNMKNGEGFISKIMVILDSNIWIGLLNVDDSCHKKAKVLFKKITETIILPEYVILEVASIISHKVGKRKSDNFIKGVINNRDVEVFPSSREFFGEVINFYLFKKSEKLSFVDYSLLYLAQKIKVLTFDKNLRKEIKKLL